jgi:hypothetical protein
MANIETLLADTRYFAEVAAPGTPAAGGYVVYAKTDGKLYGKNDAGTEHDLTASAGVVTFSGAVITEATSQSLTNDTVTALTSNDAEVADTDSYHSTVTNTERLTNTLGGTYWFKAGGTVFFAASATGLRGIRVRANGTTLIDISQLDDVGLAAGGSYLSIATGPFQLANNEYVELMAHQTSGGALNAQMQRFWIERIGS